MKCPRCLQENPSQAKFCLKCGTPFRRPDQGAQAARSYAELEHALTEAHAQVTEALDRQAAISEILRIISSSPTDLQTVFDTIARSVTRLCDGMFSAVHRFDGELLHWMAQHNYTAEGLEAMRSRYPMRASRDTASGRAVIDRTLVHVRDFESDPDVPATSREIARAFGYRSLLTVPMVRESQSVGAIAVARLAPFSAGQIALLQTFADQAAIAIENVRLFNETKEALEQQTATAEILGVISGSPTNLQPVLDAVSENAARLCEASDGVILLVEGSQLRATAHHGQAFAAAVDRPVTRDGVAGRAVIDRATIHLPDVQAADDFPLAQRLARADGTRTVLATPLVRETVAVGAILIRRAEVRPFSDKQIALLKTFADQAVIAIENVRLFTELQEKNRALTQAHAQVTESLEQQTATSEILRVIASSPTDVQPVFDTIAASASRLCGGVAAIVTRFDGEMIHLVAHHNPRPGIEPITARLYPRRPGRDTTVARAILECSIVHIPDAEKDPDLAPNLARDVRAGSFLAVPVLRDGQPIGAISVSRVETGAFLAGQVELLKTFADQAVIAIENVRLFKELEARNNELTTALDTQTATSDILRVISRAQTDVQPVFDAIVESAVRLLRGYTGALSRVAGDQIKLAALTSIDDANDAATRTVFPQPLQSEWPHALVIRNGAALNIADLPTDPAWPETWRANARVRGFRSLVVVPLLRHDKAIGAIAVTRREPGGFADDEIALLKTFGDQAVIAIENVRLFKELEARTAALTRSVEQLTALGEVGRAVSSTLDLETVLTTIVSRAVQLSGLDAGVVFEYDADAEEFVQRAATETGGALAEARLTTRIRKGEGALGRTAITLEPVQVPDITLPGAHESRLREMLIESGVRAVLVIPMVREGELIGCLGVTRNSPGGFPAEIIDLLRTFATQSALAIQNARLFHEIENKSRQLEAASQRKSEFLANMSHESRTPLNAVIGFSEVLSERMFGELNEKQDEYLKDIHASGQHLLSLINDILDLSKIEAGRMELERTDFHLPTAIDNALTLVRERAGRRGIALHQAADEGLGQIRGDERKIRQVVLNLLSNAIKFTPDGRIDVRAWPGDSVVEVSVSDTGVGIAPEDQEAIFEEFRQVGTADKKVEGTGLGLALSRKFIELHGGRIWVESQVGVGSTFTFRIPVSRGE